MLEKTHVTTSPRPNRSTLKLSLGKLVKFHHTMYPIHTEYKFTFLFQFSNSLLVFEAFIHQFHSYICPLNQLIDSDESQHKSFICHWRPIRYNILHEYQRNNSIKVRDIVKNVADFRDSDISVVLCNRDIAQNDIRAP